MALEILKGDDIRQTRVITTLYGMEGRGKTSLALTAPDPLLLDFDGGVHRAPNRAGKDVVRVTSWDQCSSITPVEVKPYKTLILDTVGSCLDQILIYLIRREPKLGAGGAPSQKCYGVLKSTFSLWLNSLLDHGLNIIFVAHTEERVQNDETIERIQATGASRQLVAHLTDVGGKVYMGPAGERLLTFSPTGLNFGKNPGLPDYVVPPPGQSPNLMAEIMRRSLVIMNEELVRDQTENDRLESLRNTLEGYTRPGQFNDLHDVMVSSNALEGDRRMLVRAARAAGLYADRNTHKFFATQADAEVGQRAPSARGATTQDTTARPAQAAHEQPAAQPAAQPTPAQPTQLASAQPAQPAQPAAAAQPEPAAQQEQPALASQQATEKRAQAHAERAQKLTKGLGNQGGELAAAPAPAPDSEPEQQEIW